MEPTESGSVTTEMRIAQEEIFGPVIGVIPVGSIDEAIQVANNMDYGLSASIAT